MTLLEEVCHRGRLCGFKRLVPFQFSVFASHLRTGCKFSAVHVAMICKMVINSKLLKL